MTDGRGLLEILGVEMTDTGADGAFEAWANAATAAWAVKGSKLRLNEPISIAGFVGNCVEGDVIIVVLLDSSFITTLNGILISLVSRPT